MDLCQIKCLQCNQLLMFHVNPSLFHGLCENCAKRLDNKLKIECIHCKSQVELIFLIKNVKTCEICKGIADVKHKNCKHFSCPDCRVGENCPACVCVLCKGPVYDKGICGSHKFCGKCSSKFYECPWCTCQHCGARNLQNYDCGHPVCSECLKVKCKLCSEICTFCKKPTRVLKGIHCKNHFGCLECYENFISRDKRCHYCAKDYQKFKCVTCEKYFFNIKSSPQLNKDKICEECLKTLEFEVSNSETKEVTNIPYQFKRSQNGNCHYCDEKNTDYIKTPCSKGYSCKACDKYNKIETCIQCSSLTKGQCKGCGQTDFIFNKCKHDLCVECVGNCPICSNLLILSQVCVCTDSETCFLCEERKKRKYDCYVCGRTETYAELKPCQHFQCSLCLTNNESKDHCSRCLNQYKCETHTRIYFLSGDAYVLSKCCESIIISKSTRKVIDNSELN